MIWISLAALAGIATLMVVRPLLKPLETAASHDSILAVYRQQLQEIDQDLERGTLSAVEADSARMEIKRRILSLRPDDKTRPSRSAPRVALLMGAVMIVLPLAIYLSIGNPSLPGRAFDPTAEVSETRKNLADEVGVMIARLETHLKANPDDSKGWQALGWAQLQTGRVGDGVASLKRAAALLPKDAPMQSMYGEALVRLADGKVGDDAMAAFELSLAADPKDPRARFYKGLHLSQGGKDDEALAIWRAIIKDGPANADWMPAIREQVAQTEAKQASASKPK